MSPTARATTAAKPPRAAGRSGTVATCAAVALLLSACTAVAGTGEGGGPVVDAWSAAASDAAAGLPRATGPYRGTVRVAEGINPPTNTWISGAVFGQVPNPVFTGVLAFKPAADGFGVGLPKVEATAKAIFGAYPEDLRFRVPADGVELTKIDSLSATLTYSKGTKELGRLTAAEGWPYLAYEAAAAHALSLAVPATDSDGGATLKVAGKTYRLLGAEVKSTANATSIDLEAGETVFLYAEPENATPEDLAALQSGAVLLKGTSTVYAVEDGQATTTYKLDTAGTPTVFAGRPHHKYSTGQKLEAGYASAYGDLSLSQGNEFTFSVAEVKPETRLDLAGLTEEERQLLASTVTADAAGVDFKAPDSYYGGKALYRASNLYVLAKDLELADVQSRLKDSIVAEMDLWFAAGGCQGATEKCFTYDPVLKGLVGQAPAYGSDELNDHHFHYGYFLYALGVLAQDDSALVAKYRPMADLMSADIASLSATEAFPQRRSFDDWAGHSWASGTSPFGDGNNQESSSEAVNAWAGLTLWGEASGNGPLLEEARWMLSNEVRTALDYWVYPELPEGFTSPLVALNWGGKRDYGTFFDSAPSAILGIQLIPFGPTMDYLRTDPAEITALVAAAIPSNSLSLPLVDYNIMFLAMADRQKALDLAQRLPDDRIDNGNSRSYLLASVLAQGKPARP